MNLWIYWNLLQRRWRMQIITSRFTAIGYMDVFLCRGGRFLLLLWAHQHRLVSRLRRDAYFIVNIHLCRRRHWLLHRGKFATCVLVHLYTFRVLSPILTWRPCFLLPSNGFDSNAHTYICILCACYFISPIQLMHLMIYTMSLINGDCSAHGMGGRGALVQRLYCRARCKTNGDTKFNMADWILEQTFTKRRLAPFAAPLLDYFGWVKVDGKVWALILRLP